MFASSNFFWINLEEINSQMIDLESNYSQIWESHKISYFNQASGTTESLDFNYTSNHTLKQSNDFSQIQNITLGDRGIMTGSTNSFVAIGKIK